MVRAILDGRKTQTRRIVRLGAWAELAVLERMDDSRAVFDLGTDRCGHPIPRLALSCPYGEPGDVLWVRETWAKEDCGDDGARVVYRADRAARWHDDADGELFYLDSNYEPSRWRPSSHMPRWASRLTLEVTDVRVERLKSISEEDALAEGCDPNDQRMRPSAAFRKLWDSIHGKRAPWDSNPWVWAVSFKVVTL
jgi:hypothetical protein